MMGIWLSRELKETDNSCVMDIHSSKTKPLRSGEGFGTWPNGTLTAVEGHPFWKLFNIDKSMCRPGQCVEIEPIEIKRKPGRGTLLRKDRIMNSEQIETIEIGEFNSVNSARVSLSGLEVGYVGFHGPAAASRFKQAFDELKELEADRYQKFTCEVKIEDVAPKTEFDHDGKRYVMLDQDSTLLSECESREIRVYSLCDKCISIFIIPTTLVKVADGTLIGKDQEEESAESAEK